MRKVAVLAAAAALVALAACGSDKPTTVTTPTGVPTVAPVNCTATSASGQTVTPGGTNLCFGSAAVVTAAKDRKSLLRITVTAIDKAPRADLGQLPTGYFETKKIDKLDMYYVRATFVVVAGPAGLNRYDPFLTDLGMSTRRSSEVSYVGPVPAQCRDNSFAAPKVGTTITGCRWFFVDTGDTPTTAAYLYLAGHIELSKRVSWSAKT